MLLRNYQQPLWKSRATPSNHCMSKHQGLFTFLTLIRRKCGLQCLNIKQDTVLPHSPQRDRQGSALLQHTAPLYSNRTMHLDACPLGWGSTAGFCYRCVMQEGSELTGFSHLWWKFDTDVAVSAQRYMERKANPTSTLQEVSDVELGSVSAPVVDSHHHLSARLQR